MKTEKNMDWTSWILENRFNGVPKIRLINIMIEKGVAEDEAIALVANAHTIAGYAYIKKIDVLYKKLIAFMHNIHDVRASYEPNFVIEKIDVPDKETFLKNYWSVPQPVVLKDVSKGWPAMTKWTLDYFEDNFGDVEVEIQLGRERDPEYEINSVTRKAKIKLKDYIQLIKANPISNDYYMCANNHTLKNPAFAKILDDTGQLPEFITALDTKGGSHLWIGPQGTITPVHHDENGLLHLQIKGRKTWKLISPFSTPDMYNNISVFTPVDLQNIDYDKYPLMKRVKIMEITVEEGEAMFVPVGWWHNVVSEGVSISLSFTTFDYPNAWTFKNPPERLF
jgi:ribosomal protein L16 Arg81 hydroxylase